jgi:hypothetical protein
MEGFTFATALDLNMGYIITSDWTPTLRKYAPLYFLGENTPT